MYFDKTIKMFYVSFALQIPVEQVACKIVFKKELISLYRGFYRLGRLFLYFFLSSNYKIFIIFLRVNFGLTSKKYFI